MRNTPRWKLCSISLVLWLLSISVFAQTPKVTLNVKGVSLSEIVAQIEKQTPYRFSYSDVVVENQTGFTLNLHDVTVQKALDEAFKNRPLSYKVTSAKSIVIFGKDQKKGQETIRTSGTVVDASGQPVIGATAHVEGTMNGVVTDADGQFVLSGVKKGAIVTISCLGYESVSYPASAATKEIVMQDDTQRLDEVVVVGYGSSRKRDLISSVSTVNASEISNVPVANITQGLAGRSPGLIVVASGGGINNKPKVSIRGGGDPIYVIDGVIRAANDFATLSPEDIESMSILKDASATAVYGSRASNGIIQVTTKNGAGSDGKAHVEYDFNYSVAQPANWMYQMNSYDLATYRNLAQANDGLPPVYDDNALALILDGSDPYNYGNWDHKKLVLRDWAPQTKHTARLVGGNENHHYFASLSNTDQKSLYKSGRNWLDRTMFRLSETANIKPIGLQVTFSLDGRREVQDNPYTFDGSSYAQIFDILQNYDALTKSVNKYGLPLSGGNNPVAATAKDAGYIKNYTNLLNGRGELLWHCLWVDGLKVRLAADYRYYSTTSKQWQHEPNRYDWDSEIPAVTKAPTLYQSAGNGHGLTTQAFVEYANTFGKHSLSALTGYEQYYEQNEGLTAKRIDFEYRIDQMDIGPASTQTNSGSDSEMGRAAFVGQLKYNYAGKYYLEGSFRYDGSDYFAEGKRWGLFFSGSAGWIVTEEPFMRPLVENNILNLLKLRASYGETGLDSSAGRFAYLTRYNLNSKSYIVDGKWAPGFTEGALPSPDLTWYTTRQTDVGFDFASLNSRLYGSFDYFYYSTLGYLVAPTGQSYLKNAIGVSLPKVKSESEHRRAGIEAQLGWKDNKGEFSYDISANFTYFDQMWAYDQSEVESSYMNPFTRKQQQRGYYDIMYHNLGYYTSAEDVYNSFAYASAINTSLLTAGDIKYEDVNGDGQLTTADQRRTGKNSMPRGQFGLNVSLGYKGFYFSSLFQGSTSFDIYQNATQFYYYFKHYYQTDTWTPENTGAKFPRLMSNSGLNSNNNTLYSDFWLISGDYVRFKDCQIGYDFKYSVMKNVKWVAKAKLGLSAQNLFTLSNSLKYGLDPETASKGVGRSYPVERILALTANIGF